MREPNHNFLFQLPDDLRARFTRVYLRDHRDSTGWLSGAIREAMEEYIRNRPSPGIGDSEGPG